MRLPARSMLALALIGNGALGLAISASGSLPGAPAWCWLAVLALGVAAHVSTEAARQRQRIDRRTRRELVKLKAAIESSVDALSREIASVSARLDQVGTPDGMKAFRDTVQAMAKDLKPIAEAFNSGKLVETMRSRMKP